MSAALRCIEGRRPGERLTLLDCELGNHTGHFAITRIRVEGEELWACDRCVAIASRHTPVMLRERAQ